MLDIIIIIAARPLLIDAGEQIMYLKFNQDNKIVSKKKKKNYSEGLLQLHIDLWDSMIPFTLRVYFTL